MKIKKRLYLFQKKDILLWIKTVAGIQKQLQGSNQFAVQTHFESLVGCHRDTQIKL